MTISEGTQERLQATFADFEQICDTAFRLSEYIRGRRDCDRAQELGSHLFIFIGMQLLELRRILGGDLHRPIGGHLEPFRTINPFSAFVLLRSLFESYLTLFYLCIETVDSVTRRFRFLYWDWYHCHSRLSAWGDDPPLERAAYFRLKARRKRLTRELCRNSRWWSLPEKRRINILGRAEAAIVKPRGKIAETAGINRAYYRLAYSYFSNFAHSGPMAVSLAALGPESEDEKFQNLTFGLELGIWMGCFAIRGVVDLFPDAYVIVHSRVFELESQWKEILRTFQQADPAREV